MHESADLIQSSGGVFEVELDNQLIYSKKATGRFPADGEVLAICRSMSAGTPLAQAQEQAARNVPKPPSFMQWLTGFMARKGN